MTYTAYITDRETKESKVFTHEDENKKNFARNLRGNGYIVHFIATPETFEEESAKYHARLEDQRIKAAAKRSTARMCRGAEQAIAEAESLIAAINANKAEATEEPTTEEPTQEVQTMRASREFFTLEEKTRKADNHFNIVADSDTEYYVSNAPSTKEAVKLAMTKYAKKLESIGTPAAALLASTVRDYLKYEYFTPECGYNYSGEGGGAFDISINDYDDGTMCVYLRVAEILEEGEEPEEAEEDNQEEAEEENQAEEKPAENEINNAFIAEMVEALEYFKRCLASYSRASHDGQSRFESDISGDLWGSHECYLLLNAVNKRLKDCNRRYDLENEFMNISECFEEISCKFKYGDTREIHEIIAEYNFS